MPKGTGIYKVNNVGQLSRKLVKSRVTVEEAWSIIMEQAMAEELRPATVRDYKRYFTKYVQFNQFKYADQFDTESIYSWLASMDVKAATKRIRLKAVRACFNRLHTADVISDKFYRNITVKVNEEVKEGATEADIERFLSCLDMGDFFQLRDATAVLLIWNTGIRAKTVSQLRMQDIDLEQQLMTCPGGIMKNHKQLVMPLPDQLTEILSVLIATDKAIITARELDTDLLFITRNGNGWLKSNGESGFSKQLYNYSKQYDLKNISPHAIRRGFAKRLLNEGVSIPVISKALGHSSLSTTTKYLHISDLELINELRRLN